MAQIIGYMVHDPVANMEWQLDDFELEHLANMESAGLLFIALSDDDTREVVKAADVVEPKPRVNGVTLVTPAYVDNRTAATAAVFDALAAIVDPESAVATADEAGGSAEARKDPVEAFKEALAAFKSLTVVEE